MRPECGQRRSGVALSIDPANRQSIRRRRLRDGQLTGTGRRHCRESLTANWGRSTKASLLAAAPPRTCCRAADFRRRRSIVPTKLNSFVTRQRRTKHL